MNRNNSSSSGTTSGTTTRTNSTSTRHNSSSGNSSGSSNNTSRGSSIGSIFMDNSIQYFNNKMKNSNLEVINGVNKTDNQQSTNNK